MSENFYKITKPLQYKNKLIKLNGKNNMESGTQNQENNFQLITNLINQKSFILNNFDRKMMGDLHYGCG